MAMEFWGVEVKAGEPLKVEQLDGILVHLSQASLGESKKDKANESVVLYVNVDGQKLVIGTLSPDKCPQISYDLVFEKEFELSHSWKNGSVYFLGYKAEMEEEEGEDGMFDSDSGSEDVEEEVPLAVPANGKPEPEAEKSKVVAAKAKAAKPDSTKAKDAKPDDDSDDGSDEEDDDSEEDSSDDEEMTGGVESDDEDDDEDEESSDEEAEAAPKNSKQNKKRAAESVANTPATQKKAKLVTPQKSGKDEKKGNAHTATPHPSKGGKTNKKADKQSPKSGSQISCKTCSKTFNSDAAMQSHTKAKHSDTK